MCLRLLQASCRLCLVETMQGGAAMVVKLLRHLQALQSVCSEYTGARSAAFQGSLRTHDRKQHQAFLSDMQGRAAARSAAKLTADVVCVSLLLAFAASSKAAAWL